MDGNPILSLFTIDFFYSTIRIAAPIAMAAIGEVYLERSGILNMGLEGMMLIGAFFGVLGSAVSGSAVIGLFTAILGGAIAGLLFGLISITFLGNQIVCGAALNILALGLTSFLSRVVWGIRLLPITVNGFEPLPVPVLSKIPFIGYVFFQQTVLVYIVYLIVGIMTFVLFRTTWGLKIRAVGENPRAADTVGMKVNKWRYGCTILNGSLAGFAGAMLSLGMLTTFVDGMTSGRGFIALSAVIFGKWNPLGAAMASLIFGAADALQMRFQAFGVPLPHDLMLMLPYLLTLIGVIVYRKQQASPASLTQPYEKEPAS